MITKRKIVVKKLSNRVKVIENKFFENEVNSDWKTDLSILVMLNACPKSGGRVTINLPLCSIKGGNTVARIPASIAIIIM